MAATEHERQMLAEIEAVANNGERQSFARTCLEIRRLPLADADTLNIGWARYILAGCGEMDVHGSNGKGM